MRKKLALDKKKNVTEIILSIMFLFFGALIKDNVVSIILFLVAYLIVGYKVINRAFVNIFQGEFLDENFLMILASIGAFIIGEYPEAVAVVICYQIGEVFEDISVDKTRESISDLMDIKPEFARVIRDGVTMEISPSDVLKGETIVVYNGERIPLDGVIVNGKTTIDQSKLTGESEPVFLQVNDKVLSGSVNVGAVVKIEVTSLYSDSTVATVLKLVEESSERKSNAESFINNFAKIYTPIVVILAVLIVMVPLFLGANSTFEWVRRAMMFLVVSCPCALLVSVPLAFFCGIGKASQNQILVKGSTYIEKASRISRILLDKTGTLTEGKFEVKNIVPFEGSTTERIIEIACLCEGNSNHPIARAIVETYKGEEIKSEVVDEIREIAGSGIYAKQGDKVFYVGNSSFVRMGITTSSTSKNETHNFPEPYQNDLVNTLIYVAENTRILGYIAVGDSVKVNSCEFVQELKQRNITPIILTGDNVNVAKNIAGTLKITDFYAGLMPNDKVQKIDEIIDNKNNNDVIVFVGDGINDAPSLMRSDLGISMGLKGSDAAIEASDVVLMKDDLMDIIKLIEISNITMSKVWQNIILSIGAKIIILLLSVFGIANMWLAVFADVGVLIMAILNSMSIYFMSRKSLKNNKVP